MVEDKKVTSMTIKKLVIASILCVLALVGGFIIGHEIYPRIEIVNLQEERIEIVNLQEERYDARYVTIGGVPFPASLLIVYRVNITITLRNPSNYDVNVTLKIKTQWQDDIGWYRSQGMGDEDFENKTTVIPALSSVQVSTDLYAGTSHSTPYQYSIEIIKVVKN
jgi:hypothetical protein